MSAAIDFLRRQLFFILCAIGGLIGIALIVTGYTAMPDIMKEMQNSEAIYSGLSSIEKQSANREFMEQEERRIAEIKSQRDEVVSKAAGLHQFKPLVEGALPNGNTELRNAFRDKYMQSMKELLESMLTGEPPNAADIAAKSDEIKEEEYQLKQQALDPSKPPPAPRGPDYNDAGVLTPDGAMTKPEERASIARAQSIHVYATRWDEERTTTTKEKVSSLDFDTAMKPRATLEAPTIEEVWWAQVGYWIQKDVVDAIIATNQEVAEQLPGTDQWVGNLPIKELISVRVKEGFIEDKPEPTAELATAGAYTEARPPGIPSLTFTGTVTSPEYDVLHFTVKLIMDQRDILKFIEKLTSNRFYTNLRIDYRRMPPNRAMKGKIYGPEPVVNVVMDFEAIFVGGGVGEKEAAFSEFRRLMPPSVCETWGIECPESEDSEEKSSEED